MKNIEKGINALDAEHSKTVVLQPITLDELSRASLTPRTIVEGFLYADVRTRIAPGGVGKTTLALYEAARLALGKPVWGKTPPRPIKTCMVSREDGRSILVARLREIIKAMDVSERERQQVIANVMIVDLSSEPYRLSCVEKDTVNPDVLALERLCEALEPWQPDWLIFDPLVSFGVGESRVNDAEQGLIEAFRILRNRLDCCVEGIHHSGKANAREGTLDQYSGRGGSALSDGSRMVVVLQPLEPKDWLKETGTHLEPGETGLIMALPKLSYSKPQDPIFIRRYGWTFSREVAATRLTSEQEAEQHIKKLQNFLSAEWLLGARYSKSALDAQAERLNMSRAEIRAAYGALEARGLAIYHEIKGKAGSHFELVSAAADIGEGIEKMPKTLH